MKNQLSSITLLVLASCLASPVSLFAQADAASDPYKSQPSGNRGQPAIDPTTGLPANSALTGVAPGSPDPTGPATISGRLVRKASDYVAGGGGGGFGGFGGAGFGGPIQAWRQGPQAGGVSLTFFQAPSPKTSDEIAEDMQTLSYLLAHNLERAFADDLAEYKLGIPILLGGEGRSVQASYIEGFGEIFKVNVRFSVVAPSGEESSPPKPGRTSEWEEAKRALGGTQAPFGVPAGVSDGNRFPAGEPYDPKLVAKLKLTILEGLKNASNLRHLEPQNWIVVTVVGAPNPGPMVRKSNRAGAAAESNPAGATEDGVSAYGVQAGRGGEPGEPDSARPTIMTLRVRMSSAQAYASDTPGKLSDEQFAKQAEVATYLGQLSPNNRFAGANYYQGAAQRK